MKYGLRAFTEQGFAVIQHGYLCNNGVNPFPNLKVTSKNVLPAKARIQKSLIGLDSGFHRRDEF